MSREALKAALKHAYKAAEGQDAILDAIKAVEKCAFTALSELDGFVEGDADEMIPRKAKVKIPPDPKNVKSIADVPDAVYKGPVLLDEDPTTMTMLLSDSEASLYLFKDEKARPKLVLTIDGQMMGLPVRDASDSRFSFYVTTSPTTQRWFHVPSTQARKSWMENFRAHANCTDGGLRDLPSKATPPKPPKQTRGFLGSLLFGSGGSSGGESPKGKQLSPAETQERIAELEEQMRKKLKEHTATAGLMKTYPADTPAFNQIRGQVQKMEAEMDAIRKELDSLRVAEDPPAASDKMTADEARELLPAAEELLKKLEKEHVAITGLLKTYPQNSPGHQQVFNQAQEMEMNMNQQRAKVEELRAAVLPQAAVNGAVSLPTASADDLPDGWVIARTPGGDIFYKHSSGKISWDRPGSETASAPALAPPVLSTRPIGTGGKMFRVLYDYDSRTDEELTVREGDVVEMVDPSDPDWASVIFKGQTGLVPATYIEPADGAVPEPAPAPAPARAPEPAPAPAPRGFPAAPAAGEPVSAAGEGWVKMRVLFDYDANIPEELTIREGDLLDVKIGDDPEWYDARTPDGKLGVVPFNYVEAL